MNDGRLYELLFHGVLEISVSASPGELLCECCFSHSGSRTLSSVGRPSPFQNSTTASRMVSGAAR